MTLIQFIFRIGKKKGRCTTCMVLVLFSFALSTYLYSSYLNKETHGHVWVTASNSQSFVSY